MQERAALLRDSEGFLPALPSTQNQETLSWRPSSCSPRRRWTLGLSFLLEIEVSWSLISGGGAGGGVGAFLQTERHKELRSS